MPAKVVFRKEIVTITEIRDLTVSKLLKHMQLLPEAHIVIRSGELLTEQELIRDGDELRIVPVISGGMN